VHAVHSGNDRLSNYGIDFNIQYGVIDDMPEVNATA
jgi:hypothetical protein